MSPAVRAKGDHFAIQDERRRGKTPNCLDDLWNAIARVCEVSGEHAHLVVQPVDLDPRSVVEEHDHPHEQVGMVLRGRATFFIGGEERTLGPGDMFRIPGGVRHKVLTLDEPTQILDIFSPVRDEYR